MQEEEWGQSNSGEEDIMYSPLGINDLPPEALHLIFGFLGPGELCRTSAVCKAWRDLNKDASANRVWESHYAKRWRVPWSKAAGAWQEQYSQKMRNAKAFSSKGLADILYGHSAAVSAIALLPACNLLATGSADSTVRLWDLEAGLPIACSRNLRHTVRALSLDDTMLACAGGQDGAIRLWRCRTAGVEASSKFDLTLPTKLSGHTGPVVSLASDRRLLYSASWDCSVRLWSKASLRRESLLAFPDWVHSAKPCGSNLLVTAGQTLYICDSETGQTVGKHLHSALPGNIHWESGRPVSPLQVEGSQDSRLIFLAGSDGAIVAIDPRTSRQITHVLWDQNSAVKGLSFEDPWLAAATYSGSILLLDIEQALKAGKGPEVSSAARRAGKAQSKPGRATRQRLSGPKGPALCVDMADSHLACGSGDPVVRTWAFQHPDKGSRRPQPASRRPRTARTLRNRLIFSSSSSEEDEGGDCGDASDSACVRHEDAQPMSQSLPACFRSSQCSDGRQRPKQGGGHQLAPGPSKAFSPDTSDESSLASMSSIRADLGKHMLVARGSSGEHSPTEYVPCSDADAACFGSAPDSPMDQEELRNSPPALCSPGPARAVPRQRGILVPVPLRCRAEARRLMRRGIEN